jgi:hypothetical protein
MFFLSNIICHMQLLHILSPCFYYLLTLPSFHSWFLSASGFMWKRMFSKKRVPHKGTCYQLKLVYPGWQKQYLYWPLPSIALGKKKQNQTSSNGLYCGHHLLRVILIPFFIFSFQMFTFSNQHQILDTTNVYYVINYSWRQPKFVYHVCIVCFCCVS